MACSASAAIDFTLGNNASSLTNLPTIRAQPHALDDHLEVRRDPSPDAVIALNSVPSRR